MAKKKQQEDIPSTELEKVNTSGDNIVNKIWNLFSSMKLGITLLFVVAVTSIIGTVWTQINEASPTGKFYNSKFYVVIMAVLLLNLLVCSINRFKHIVATLKGPRAKVSETTIKNLKYNASIKIKGDVESAGNIVQQVLSQHGYRIFTAREEGKIFFGTDKGRLGVMGPYLTHISFIIIIVALWISFSPIFSFQGNVYGKVGSSFNSVQDITVERGQMKENFDVKVNDFKIIYRPDGSVDRYQSDLAVVENGMEAVSKRIIVNDPLRYKGYSFYQSSYEYGLTGKINGQPFNVILDKNTQFQVPNTDLVIVPNGSQGNQMSYTVYKAGQQIKQGNADYGKPVTVENANFQFDSMDAYTGLQVVKDPGKPIVFVGSILLVLGILISFLLINRKIWVIVSESNGFAYINIGGLTQKNKPAFEKQFKLISEELKIKRGESNGSN